MPLMRLKFSSNIFLGETFYSYIHTILASTFTHISVSPYELFIMMLFSIIGKVILRREISVISIAQNIPLRNLLRKYDHIRIFASKIVFYFPITIIFVY